MPLQRVTGTVPPARQARRRRGWLVTRALVAADGVGLVVAFAVAEALFGGGEAGPLKPGVEFAVLVASLPAWLAAAKLYRLYDLDDQRTAHTTVGDIPGVFHLATVGVWAFFVTTWLTGVAHPSVSKLFGFWLFTIVLVCSLRAAGRLLCRRSDTFVQKTLIVGAGSIGKLVARKYAQHGEYGIDVVGFVDDAPLDADAWGDLPPVVGGLDDLDDLVRRFDAERIVVAFSNDDPELVVPVLAAVRDLGVQVDIVPRLFDVMGPHMVVHDVEGVPLVALPSPKRFPFSLKIKSAFDRTVAAIVLIVLSPLLAYIALRIRRDSPGPILFRQQRIGQGMREFTALKFRTMRADTDDREHRAYIAQTMSSEVPVDGKALFKLDQADAVTPFGRWLRRTSLDELPQLFNVLRGDMALVGPRPCIAYELEHFEKRHFERFRVPAGITGLWQVTARAHSTFGEALDMDVAYARNWSLGLDLRLLLLTPVQLWRQRQGTA